MLATSKPSLNLYARVGWNLRDSVRKMSSIMSVNAYAVKSGDSPHRQANLLVITGGAMRADPIVGVSFARCLAKWIIDTAGKFCFLLLESKAKKGSPIHGC